MARRSIKKLSNSLAPPLFLSKQIMAFAVDQRGSVVAGEIPQKRKEDVGTESRNEIARDRSICEFRKA